jgi:sialate O-acetylesterase
MKIEGSKIRLSFDCIGGGLVSKGDELKGFAIAGEDEVPVNSGGKKFYWANAVIEGDTIVVSSENVGKPIAVRYAWADNPECNLYNKAGLPASPFRTDDSR